MKNNRESHLDSLRGIAALIVVIVHYLAAFYPYAIFGNEGGYQQHSSLEGIFFFPVFGLVVSGHFAVCLFFILSGYVISYQYLGERSQIGNIIKAIIKRPIRLGGLVYISIIFAAILWYFDLFLNLPASELTTSQPWFSNFWKGNFEFSNLFYVLTTSAFSDGNHYNPPLWTIKIELYGSIMVYIFLLFFGRFKFRVLLLFSLIFVFYNSLYQGFWIGLTIAEVIKHHKSIKKFIAKPYCYWIIFILFVYFSAYPNYTSQNFISKTIYSILPDDVNFGGGYPMFSALLVFLLVSSSLTIQKLLRKPILKFLGKISYALYVMHIMFIGSISSWLYLYFYNDFGHHISFVIAFGISMPCIILTSYLATLYVDIPSIHISKYVSNRFYCIILFWRRMRSKV